MSNCKRRKLNEENRKFNVKWELDFFFTSVKDKMVCLLCDTVLTTLKRANANKHYLTHKEHKYFNLEGESRQAVLQKLKNEKHHQQASFSAFLKKNTAVTYKIAHILGKRGKPLTSEHTELGIADFDEIWHECSFRKNIRPVFFFICNG